MTKVDTASIQKKLNTKTKRGKREQMKRAPMVFENPKTCLFLKSSRSSAVAKAAAADLASLKGSFAKKLTHKNDLRPFEDQTKLEFLCEKNDASLFVFSSKTKKKPNCLTIGRCFNYQMLDMAEFVIEPNSFESMTDVHKRVKSRVEVQYDSKPCLLFVGDEFEIKADFVLLRNLFIDLFQGEVVDKINLAGVSHTIVFTIQENTIVFRRYGIRFKKSGTRVPDVELEELGPRMDMTLSRRVTADDDVIRRAMRKPKEAVKSKTKNLERGAAGQVLGRIHMQRQDIEQMALRKLKKPKQTQ